MIFTPAYAQAGAAPAGPGILETLLPFVFIFVIMYFLIIRPQQKRMREHREMVAGLRRGDEVVTAGGLIAKVTRVKEGDEEIEVELGQAEGKSVRARMVRATVSSVVSKTEPAAPANDAKKS